MSDLTSPAQIIRTEISLREVVSHYVRLKRLGSRYVGLCPFHPEKTPSFGVHASDQFYKCFGCDAGGDVFKFIQDIEGITFPEALRLLTDRYAIDVNVDRRPQLPKPEYDRARKLAVHSVEIRAKARRALLIQLIRLWLVRLKLDDHFTRVSGANLARWQAVDNRLEDLMMAVQAALTTVCDASATEILDAAARLKADAA
ncbi:MAG: CHC2 zinc finger domain-containing protein [Bryobacteraceae bacterium]